MSEELKAALARIACLEGEIAKRDEELAACRVAVENCEVFRARIAELEARIVWLECEAQVNAAPVSEAKAHGNYAPASVVWIDAHHVIEGNNPSFIKDVALVSAERTSETQIPLARLTAAPVQQVSVPDVSAMARILADRNADACNVNREDNWAIYGQDYIYDVTAMLTAAPAAPAADAGLVEALETIINPIEAMRRELQVGEQLNGMVAMQLASDPEYLRGVAKAAIAAHRAKGVV